MYENKKLNVFIDAEWGSKEQFMSFQALITGKGLPSGKYILFHSQYREFLEGRNFVEGHNSSENYSMFFAFFRRLSLVFRILSVNQSFVNFSQIRHKKNFYDRIVL